MIIGVSGVAGAGKDLFVKVCISELEKRGKKAGSIAIATSLKTEVLQWCLDHYGIDSVCGDREQKEKIREFLVFHGTMKRKASNGRHWISLANDAINSMRSSNDYIFVSDVRYDDYPEYEVHWIKEELGGSLVHVSQYTKPVRGWDHEKIWRKPANKEEERNDPKLEAKADYKISWEFIKNINKDKYIASEVVTFIEWLSTR